MTTGRRLRVLAVAFACAPGRGSEPAAGWGLTRAVADAVDLTVLVGARHEADLAHWRRENPDAPGRYVSVPEPTVLPGYPRTHAGWFLRYLRWLPGAVRAGRELHEQSPFDAVWHCSYSAYWLPSPATRIGPPTLWGPVGGAVATPLRLWPLLGWAGLPVEVAERLAVLVAARAPATMRTMRSATGIVVQNEETLRAVQRHVRTPPAVLNHALFTETPPKRHGRSGPRDYVLHLSRLESRKAPALAARALAGTPSRVRLVYAGDGPQADAVARVVERLDLTSRVTLLGRVPHDEVFRLIAGAAAVVFTGLREEGGIALAETLLAGTPAIVLATGGARTIAAAATDPGRVALVEPTTVGGVVRRLGEAMTAFVDAPSAPEDEAPLLDRDLARRRLVGLLEEAAGGGRGR